MDDPLYSYIVIHRVPSSFWPLQCYSDCYVSTSCKIVLREDVVVVLEMLYKKHNLQLPKIWFTHIEVPITTILWVIEEKTPFPLIYLLLTTITYEGF